MILVLQSITYRRPDGSFVGVVNGLPYHITEGSAFYAAAQAAGASAPFEPVADVTLSDASVNAERDRRIRVGKTFAIPGYGNVQVEGREVDMRNLNALGTAALAAIGAGAGATTMQFRGADNTIHTLTWAQMFALWQLSTAYVSAIYAASWAIKDAPPIPADYANNSYWPE